MDREIRDILPLVSAEGHLGEDQFMKKIGIGAYEQLKFRIVRKRGM